MARAKKSIKGACNVSICKRKLSNGHVSLFLKWVDINGNVCKESCKGEDGKVLHLIDDKAPYANELNSNAINRAKAQQASKVIALMNGETKQATQYRAKTKLYDWIQALIDERQKNGYSVGNYCSLQTAVYHFAPNATLANVTKSFIMGFQDFLKNKTIRYDTHKTSRKMQTASIRMYINKLNTCMKIAQKTHYIDKSPFDDIEGYEIVKIQAQKRGFLTADEVERIKLSTIVNNEVKRAFLFSCYCGLRFCDIEKLRRCDIVNINERYYANIVIKKTNKPYTIPLNKKAIEHLNLNLYRGDDLLFDLPNASGCNKALKTLAKRANINKNISFHIARHTFATLMANKYHDVATLSKLLGHSNIETTQVYFDIANETMCNAVDALNDI